MIRTSAVLQLEPLESRRAPATLVNPKTVSFQDADGDAATVVLSKPVLTTANVGNVFKFDIGSFSDNNTRQQLQAIDLTGFASGLSVTATATAANGGDGKVNVGWVKADGKDLGTVTISGDLGRITAGNPAVGGQAIKSLSVGSIGVKGLTTQAAGGSLASTVTGPIGKLTVAGDVTGASVTVSESKGKFGNIGTVKIGGSLIADPIAPNTGLISTIGPIGSITITGDVVGGAGDGSGIHAATGYITRLGKVTIGGSLKGGAGAHSGIVSEQGSIASVTIAGDIKGGGGKYSGSVYAYYSIGPVTVKSITGGGGDHSGAIVAHKGKIGNFTTGDITGGSGGDSGAVEELDTFGGGMGAVHIADLIGGTGAGSASLVFFGGTTKSISITGNVTGGSGVGSAEIVLVDCGAIKIGGNVTGSGPGSASMSAADRIAAIAIGGNVTGGAGGGSAVIGADSNQKTKFIGSLTIAGDVVGGDGDGSATIAADGLGTVSVKSLTGGKGVGSASISTFDGFDKLTVLGDVKGGIGDNSGQISSENDFGAIQIGGSLIGGAGKLSAAIDGNGFNDPFPGFLSVKSITIDGSVTGGTGLCSASILARLSIGQVKVGGSWTGASIAAGWGPGADGYFGTGDDVQLIDFFNLKQDGVIAGITIGGAVNGTVASGDSFAFQAHTIKALSINGAATPLKSGPANDNIPLGTTADFKLIEE
jgi:hypothetical protein